VPDPEQELSEKAFEDLEKSLKLKKAPGRNGNEGEEARK
jgi:hypothetical protein